MKMERQAWIDHTFYTTHGIGWQQTISTRIGDTVLRLSHHTATLNDHELSAKLNDAWSIKEHIGHLIDLEEFHLNRLNQFPTLPEVLDAVEISNAKTYASDHNVCELKFLLT